MGRINPQALTIRSNLLDEQGPLTERPEEMGRTFSKSTSTMVQVSTVDAQ